MKQVLVTGADGWLGSRFCEIFSSRFPSVPIRTFQGDLRNPADCRRFCEGARGATLFHTAGVIHPRRVREFYEVNVGGTVNLLDAAIASGVRRAIVISSNSPCGCNPHPDHLFDEQSPYRPYMNYGRSKMLMEQAVQQRQRSGGIETVIVRAPWFYGPRQPSRQTLFFKMVRDGKAPIVGGGENRRSMAYLDNLCEGMILAATVERANGQLYWIADKRPYTMNEIVDTIERLLETEFGVACARRRLRLPNIVSQIAWLADKIIQGLGFYHQKIHVLSEMNKDIACSIAKAEKELGYRPEIELEEGMRRSMRWCVEHGVNLKD
ncbi:MAG: NAD(P)-dependent oxidoreductase [Verrucomicrobiae bacterium]|nr:NAD(P)-dependent oxidoreductase [Verrucomicrobiae bacterium]